MDTNAKTWYLRLLVCLMAVFVLWVYQVSHTRTKLTIGVFVGSAWDVPSGDGYAVTDTVIKSFQEEHPEVDVTYVSGIKREDYREWLAEQLLKGTEPDVFMVPAEDFDTYARMGAIRNLTDISQRDRGFDEDGFYKVALDCGRIRGGALYALPVECAPTMMFVNKTLLDREGIGMPSSDWTWQDFYSICARVTKDTDGDGVLDQFGVYDYTWRLAALTNGVQLFSKGGRFSYFADPRMEQGVNFLLSLRKLRQGQEVTSRDVDLGRVAFRPFTFAEYKTYKPYPWRIKKFSDSEWDCVRLPAGPQGRNVSPVSTLLLAMSNRTSEPGLAWQLMKKLCMDPGVQMSILEKSQGLPVRREVVLQAAAKDQAGGNGAGMYSMDLAAVSSIMEEAVPTPTLPDQETAMMMAERSMQEILSGEVSVANALHKLQKDVNAYLQR